ncbi:GNAT family N-acetyltransferase [Pseudonocardia sp. TRM90224]|uniref:GNAT family N-acetyltransferase n=1 Tax=Pseudonocardia sp. TRM90224 TaxID=2812678 RepID=UPI001E5B3A9B|nr:GNAT family N-acetyltransferase [Pseudonocardia sp. TRM90224]
MKLEPVTDGRALREFIGVTDRIYGRDPRFVPPTRAAVRGWHADPAVGLHVLRDGSGNVVARTTLHADDTFDAKLGRRMQLFGLTEFVDDPAVAAALFDGIDAAARRSGRDEVFGPVSLLPNQSGGVVTSGFADRGFVDSAWNHPYYPAAYERHGFEQRFRSDTWICPDLQADDREAGEVFAFDDRRIAAEELVVHRGRRRGLDRQLPLLREMLNASFAQLGYYTEISAEQLRAATDGLAFLLDEGLLLYLTKAGRPIAFVLCVPDISEFLSATGGNLHPANQLRLLATRGRYRRDAVLIIKGVVPDEQRKGYAQLLNRELLRNLRAGGYRTLRSTWVERTNNASAAQYRAMGGRPLHGYTFYAKAVA